MDEESKIIEETMSLNSLDSTLLSLIIFFIALGVSILSLVSLDIIKKFPIIIIPYLSILLLILPTVSGLFLYVPSVIFPKNKFSSKIFAITFLGFSISLTILYFVLSIFIFTYQINFINLPYFGEILAGLVILVSFLFTIFYIYPQTKKFFREQYPCLLFRRIKRMNKKSKIRNLKKFNITYKELKRLTSLEKF
jgi:hypothetical protein